MILSEEDLEKIKKAVADYQSSPWYHFGHATSEESMIKLAEEEGTQVALDDISRSDSSAFHKEEASMGNI